MCQRRHSIHHVLLLVFLAGSHGAWGQDIRVAGAPEELRRNIESLVGVPNLACDSSPRTLNRNLADLRDRVTRAARALGYYRLTQETEFASEGACWSLRIVVDPGEPLRVGKVSVLIDGEQGQFQATLDALPMSPGDQLNHALYERIKADLSARAVELGFFDARFARSELQLDLQAYQANVAIEFDLGERYRFGNVEIEALDALSDPFIRRFVHFQAGDYYSADDLIRLRSSLSNSLYFSGVSVSPALDRATDARVPVQLALQPRPRRAYSVGGGFTTDMGPRARFDYEDRYLNRRGHLFDFNSAIAPVQQSFDATYAIPRRDPGTQRVSFSGGFLREDNDTYIANTTKLGVNYGFVNRWDWRQNLFINFQHDVFEVGEQDDIANLLIPGINLTRTQADNTLLPEHGWRLYGQLTGASNAFFSTKSFLQLNLAGKYVQRLGPGRVLLKFEAGTTLTDDIEKLPASIQYFTGGDQSVRGYKYQSLGPTDATGQTLGGKHLLVGGIEYDFNILPNWKLALFIDAGNAFLDFKDYDLKTGAGIGIRWLSPLGPLRVDLASGLENDNDLRIHITMGPDL